MLGATQIRASRGFSKLELDGVLSRANAVSVGMTGNPAFTNPPVDPAALKTAADSLSAAIAEALDGGMKAFAHRNGQKKAVIRMLRQLATYVEENCNDDLAVFVTSGFEAISPVRATLRALSQSIRKIEPGDNSGQLLVKVAAAPGALTYELRWAAVGDGGTPGAWMSQPVGRIRQATPVVGLTPGTVYAFQVRALNKSGYTDWSDSVTRMCM